MTSLKMRLSQSLELLVLIFNKSSLFGGRKPPLSLGLTNSLKFYILRMKSLAVLVFFVQPRPLPCKNMATTDSIVSHI
jgi:hypothetical protein